MFPAWSSNISTAGREITVDHKPDGTAASAFAGSGGHGYEAETQAPTVTVDGATVALTDGQTVPVAGSATITRKSAFYHPELTLPTAEQTIRYRLDLNGLHQHGEVKWLAGGMMTNSYFLQRTCNLPHVQLDGAATAYRLADDVAYPNLAWLGDGEHTGVIWWGEDDATSRAHGDLKGRIVLAHLFPLSSNATRGYSGTHKVAVRKWADDLRSKLYGQASAVRFEAGTTWMVDQTLIVGLLADGAALSLPRP